MLEGPGCMKMEPDAKPEDTTEDRAPVGLEGLDDQQLNDLRQTLRHQIDHMAQRIEYTESRLSRLTLVAAAFVAAGVALLPVVLTQLDVFGAVFPLAVLTSSVILLGLLVWYVYARQTNFPYPFVEVAQTRKWFYHYAIDKAPFTTPWYKHPSPELRERGKTAYESQWKEFRENRVRDLADLRTDILQDLEQVFLLHVNERYKNLFLTHLRDLFKWGIPIILLLTFISLAVAVPVDVTVISHGDEATSMAPSTHTGRNVVVESSWRGTGNARTSGIAGTEVEILLNISVENIDENVVTVDGLVAKDRFGLTLPISIESQIPRPLTVSPGSTVEIVALVWIPASVIDDLHHFEVPE